MKNTIDELTMAEDQPGGLAGRSAGSGEIQLSLAEQTQS